MMTDFLKNMHLNLLHLYMKQSHVGRCLNKQTPEMMKGFGPACYENTPRLIGEEVSFNAKASVMGFLFAY
jgi:hypothetical protein